MLIRIDLKTEGKCFDYFNIHTHTPHPLTRPRTPTMLSHVSWVYLVSLLCAGWEVCSGGTQPAPGLCAALVRAWRYPHRIRSQQDGRSRKCTACISPQSSFSSLWLLVLMRSGSNHGDSCLYFIYSYLSNRSWLDQTVAALQTAFLSCKSFYI